MKTASDMKVQQPRSAVQHPTTDARIPIPLNLYSIGDIGQWRSRFYWPISHREVYEVELACAKKMISAIRALPGEVRPALRIAASWLYTQFNDWCAEMIAAQRLRSLSDTYQLQYNNWRAPSDVYLPDNNNIDSFYRGGLPRFDYDGWPQHPTARSGGNWRRRLRSLAGRVYLQSRLCKSALIGPTPHLAVNPNHDTLAYLEKHRIRFKYLKTDQFFEPLDPHALRTAALDAAFVSAGRDLVKIIGDIYEKHTNVQMDQRIEDHFRSCLVKLLKVICIDLQNVRKRRRRLSGKRVYTGTGGNYFTRVLATVARENGSEVMGFPHGGSSACIHFPKFALTEMEFCDTFVCYDHKEREVNRRYQTIDNQVAFRVEPGLMPSLLNCKVSRRCREIDFDRIETVMCVAPGYFLDRHGSQIIPETVHFEFEIHLIEFFLRLGKKIVYKNRPKSAHYSPHFNMFDIFKGMDVAFEARPFSDPAVLAQADVFVFTKVASTALYEAMTLTEKPIILFHPDIPKLTEQFKALGRVHVVHLTQDHQNRMRFDEQRFCNDYQCQKTIEKTPA